MDTHFIKSSVTFMDFSKFLPYSKTELIKEPTVLCINADQVGCFFFGALPMDAWHSKQLYHVFLQDLLQLQPKSLHLEISSYTHLAKLLAAETGSCLPQLFARKQPVTPVKKTAVLLCPCWLYCP